MRLNTLLPAMLAAFAGISAAHADSLPVGTYSLFGRTTTTGIHQSVDQGTLSGTVTFNNSSQVSAANLVFNDLSDGLSFAFTVPGATSVQGQFLSATISNANNSAISYAFSINTGTSSGVYQLTCGVDCDTDVIIPDSTGRTTLNEEVTGTLAPEPSSIALLGTGMLATVGAWRRRRLA